MNASISVTSHIHVLYMYDVKVTAPTSGLCEATTTTMAHAINVSVARATMAGTNTLAIRSAKRWIGAWNTK